MHKKGESMKLTIHIEKKHAYFIVAGLVLLSSLIFVIGTGYTSGAFHETLFADIIRGKSSAAVQVQDDLTVSGNLGVGITSPTEKLDVDGNQEIAQRYGVMSIPTTIVFKKGQPVDMRSGALNENEIVKMAEKAK